MKTIKIRSGSWLHRGHFRNGACHSGSSTAKLTALHTIPRGEMTSGELHTGPEPDWSFTDEIYTVDLQLNDPWPHGESLLSKVKARSM